MDVIYVEELITHLITQLDNIKNLIYEKVTMLIDLLSIEDSCRTQKESEKFTNVNDCLISELIKLVPESKELFNAVICKALKCNKILKIRIAKKADSSFEAYTKSYKNEITICLTSPIELEKLSSILVHELGEADYVTSQFPFLDDPEIQEMYKIVEIFSHPHIRQLATYHKLESIEGLYRERLTEFFLHNDYIKEYLKPWKIILMICWAIQTFPVIKEYKENLKGYQDYKNSVERILVIRDSLNTNFCTKEEVRFAFEEIVEHLESLGMPDPGEIS
ncbi:hypothetical protein B14911_03364 [Bacillus sp. NRRL B-14911]|nr:hypothetical protein B14911_03364 [Bacillus sp. NRRL B-14911]